MFGRQLLILPLLLTLACGAQDDRLAPATPVTEPPADRSDPGREDQRQRILFLGDSLTAGFGIDPEQAFPALIQERIDERGWPFEVVNAGVSGDTTSSGLRRLDWLLERPVDILFLELGGNDGLRGIDLGLTRQNLEEIITKVRQANPDAEVVVAGMLVPPNMGPDYFESFRAIFPEVAAKHESVLIPFLLEGVAGRPELNLPDGIHPTVEGHRIIADLTWDYLEPLLKERALTSDE